jgi:hypothetical protein
MLGAHPLDALFRHLTDGLEHVLFHRTLPLKFGAGTEPRETAPTPAGSRSKLLPLFVALFVGALPESKFHCASPFILCARDYATALISDAASAW